MELTQTREEYLNLYQGLQRIDLRGAKFNYALAKIKKTLKGIQEAIQEASKAPEGYQDYLQKRNELLQKHAEPLKEPDENGNIPYQFQDDESKKAFEEEEGELKEEFRWVLEKQEQIVEEVNEMLKEKETVDFHTIKEESIPDDISTSEMDYILPFVEEN